MNCPVCGDEVRPPLWNGRCYDCHEEACAFPLAGDCAPEGFDPAYAGEVW